MDDFLEANFELKLSGWSFSEIENMMPWERTIYMAHLKAYIAQKNKNQSDGQ